MDNFTFPIPLPVIMKDEKEYAEEEAWKEQEERQLKIQEEILQEELKNNVFALNQLDLLGDGFSSIEDKPGIKKEKEKQVKAWGNIFKLKVFEKTLLGIKGIASSLGGGLFDTLIGLMLWAFIDPNGSLMMSLINIFVSLSVMVIKMFARMLPVVIKMILNLIPVVIKAFLTIITAVIDVLPEIIQSISKLLPMIFKTLKDLLPGVIVKLMDAVILAVSQIKDKIPFLKPILEFIEQMAGSIKNLFDPNGGEIKSKLLTFAKDTFINLMDALWNQFKNIRNLAAEVFGEKTIRLLESALILFGLMQAAISAHNAIIAISTFAEWAKTAATAGSLPSLFAATAAIWALAAPMLPIVLAVAAVIAAFVLLYVFWDEIAEWFGKAWDWFVDNALDWLIDGFRLLMLPFTWPIEIGWYIYKNWEKIKNKFSDGIKAFQQIFPNISKTISDIFNGFKNIKIGDVGDMIFKAFDTALLGIPSLLRKAFSNIPGAEAFRKGWEELVNWFAKSKVGKWVDSILGGGDKKSQSTFEKSISNIYAGEFGNRDETVLAAKDKLENSGVDANLLKDVLMGKKVSELGLDMSAQQQLSEDLKTLEKAIISDKKDAKAFENIKKDIASNDSAKIASALSELAKKSVFQNVIGFVGNATISKSDKR